MICEKLLRRGFGKLIDAAVKENEPKMTLDEVVIEAMS